MLSLFHRCVKDCSSSGHMDDLVNVLIYCQIFLGQVCEEELKTKFAIAIHRVPQVSKR